MNRSRIRLAAALLAIAAALMPFFSMKSYARSETATVGKSFDVYLVGYSESMVEIAGISGSLPPGIKYYTGDGRGIGVRGTPTQAGSYSATFYYTVENVYTGSTYEDSISIDITVKAAPTPTPKQADPAPTPTPARPAREP